MSLAQDLHQAVAGVMRVHGLGLVSRLVFAVELVEEGSGELGLHRYAVTDIEAVITASKLAGEEEGE
ncbi:hypothetical protein [Streptomyces sp. NPDC046942]|uniref:hypothetical protein n=1 Tax=Streptomyces sp. NPDC046942 TaxID=3155137 RepID=UPI0033E4B5BD